MDLKHIADYAIYRVKNSAAKIPEFFDCPFDIFLVARFIPCIIFLPLSFINLIFFDMLLSVIFPSVQTDGGFIRIFGIEYLKVVPLMIFLVFWLLDLFYPNPIEYDKYLSMQKKPEQSEAVPQSAAPSSGEKSANNSRYLDGFWYYFILYGLIQMTFIGFVMGEDSGDNFEKYFIFIFFSTHAFYFMSPPQGKRIYVFFNPILWVLMLYFVSYF